MAKVELKTKENNANVDDFINSVKDNQQRDDSKVILKMMGKATGDKPKMWGSSIVGFGNETLKYESGRELEWFKIGFSPRKQSLTLYVLRGGENNYKNLLAKLGKHTLGKGCLYIKNLEEVDSNVLEDLIKESLRN